MVTRASRGFIGLRDMGSKADEWKTTVKIKFLLVFNVLGFVYLFQQTMLCLIVET